MRHAVQNCTQWLFLPAVGFFTVCAMFEQFSCGVYPQFSSKQQDRASRMSRATHPTRLNLNASISPHYRRRYIYPMKEQSPNQCTRSVPLPHTDLAISSPVMYSATSLTAANQRNQPQDLNSRIPLFWFGTQLHVSICAQTNQLPPAKVRTSLKRYGNQFDRRCGSHGCGRIPYLGTTAGTGCYSPSAWS